MDGHAVILETTVDRDLTDDQVDTIALTVTGSAAYNSGSRSLRYVLGTSAADIPGALAEALGAADRAAGVAGFGYACLEEARVLTHARLEAETFRPASPRGGLAGTAEVAQILGVARQRVPQLLSDRSGFPRPVAELAATPVWDRAEVEAFARTWERRPGRPRKPAGGNG